MDAHNQQKYTPEDLVVYWDDQTWSMEDTPNVISDLPIDLWQDLHLYERLLQGKSLSRFLVKKRDTPTLLPHVLTNSWTWVVMQGIDLLAQKVRQQLDCGVQQKIKVELFHELQESLVLITAQGNKKELRLRLPAIAQLTVDAVRDVLMQQIGKLPSSFQPLRPLPHSELIPPPNRSIILREQGNLIQLSPTGRILLSLPDWTSVWLELSLGGLRLVMNMEQTDWKVICELYRKVLASNTRLDPLYQLMKAVEEAAGEIRQFHPDYGYTIMRHESGENVRLLIYNQHHQRLGIEQITLAYQPNSSRLGRPMIAHAIASIKICCTSKQGLIHLN